MGFHLLSKRDRQCWFPTVFRYPSINLLAWFYLIAYMRTASVCIKKSCTYTHTFHASIFQTLLLLLLQFQLLGQYLRLLRRTMTTRFLFNPLSCGDNSPEPSNSLPIVIISLFFNGYHHESSVQILSITNHHSHLRSLEPERIRYS